MSEAKKPRHGCCAERTQSICKMHSKIKMVVKIKLEFEHLYPSPNTRTRYSLLGYNHKPLNKTTAEDMWNRLKSNFKNHGYWVGFFDNQNPSSTAFYSENL